MGRWLKTLRPYWFIILIIMGLLFIQAMCDLRLPDYTSKIIDTGIQAYGIEHTVPEKITQEEFKNAEIFMDESEKKLWEDSYTLNGNVYELKAKDTEAVNKLDEELSTSLILDSQFSQVTEESLDQIIEEMAPEGDSEVVAVTPESLGITEYPADLRPAFTEMIGSGQITSADLDEIKDRMSAQIDVMGGENIRRSMGALYAKNMEEQAGVDISAKQQAYLWSTGGMMILVAAVMAAAMIIVSFLASRVGASVGRDLRKKIYTNVMHFSNAEIEKFSSASLITRTTNDIQQIQMTTVLALRIMLFSPIMAIGGIIRVASTGADMWWVIGLAIICIIGIIIFLFTLVMPKFKIVQKIVDNVNRVTREIITGLPVIRAFGTEKKEEKRFADASYELYKVQLFINKAISFMLPAFMFIMFGVSALVVWVGAWRIDAGMMRVGQMTAFMQYAMQIIMSFVMLTVMAVMVPRAAVAANRVDEVINTESSIKNKEGAKAPEHVTGNIEFKNVSFAYPGADGNVLEDITFKAEAGKTTAIIGSTGCGKSTIVQLIPRLYDPTSGSVTFDGTDLRDLKIDELRKNIGYVPQQRILFSGDIRSNIAYGNENATDEEVKTAARIAQAEDFIEAKELKYDSPISQGGTNVSGGQNQRLSIARALAKHPKVYVFDDSFSALDLKTDRQLRQALKENVGDSTIIIVAQRVSTILDADQILVMENGRLAGKGTHRELLENCTTYREIAESQMTKEELYGKEVLV